jgi:SAM-dependent methyltransferase
MTDQSSIAYYDANAWAFSADTLDADMNGQRAWFSAHVPAGGAVLEAGCGAGRDALAFLRAGYEVTAFDGSAAMAKLTSELTGRPALHMTFSEIAWEDRFDGVWACASLLHVPRADLPDILGRIAQALKPGGVFFASFKLGAEERHANGRYFNDMTAETLAPLLIAAGLQLVETRISADARPGRENEQWVSAISRRPLVETPARA